MFKKSHDCQKFVHATLVTVDNEEEDVLIATKGMDLVKISWVLGSVYVNNGLTNTRPAIKILLCWLCGMQSCGDKYTENQDV